MELKRALRWYYQRLVEIGNNASPAKTIRDFKEWRTRKRLFGHLATLVPRVADMFEGPQNLEVFKRNGEDFLQIYKLICGLQPNDECLTLDLELVARQFI